MRQLTLTNDQFDALYELLDETIADISSDLDLELVNLNDIEIYQVWQQMNNYQTPKVTLTPEDNDPVIINLPEGTNLKKVVRTPAQSPQNKDLDLQKLFKDYPRDGFALALLPLLLLEALTKEGLKLAGVSV